MNWLLKASKAHYAAKAKARKSQSGDRHHSLRYVGDDNAIEDDEEEEEEIPQSFSVTFEDETADIDAGEMTSRLLKSVHNNSKSSSGNGLPPRIALAYASSKTSKKNRRQSSNKREVLSVSVAVEGEAPVAEEEDGWISVGPKHHHNNHHNHHNHHRKSFNHDQDHHRKKFNETNRQARVSFSKANAPNLARPANAAAPATASKAAEPVKQQEPAASSAIEEDDDNDDAWETPKKTARARRA
ncbi:hypothetical protein DUD61_000215 [Geotrichum candidum]|nr:hypothetical protein DUD61_000215 [Geotrichum candidum]